MSTLHRIHFHLTAGLPDKMPFEYSQHGTAVIVPRKGDMVSVHEDDDFRRVDEVYLWASSDKSVEVFFEDDEAFTPAQLKAAGWKRDPMPKVTP